MSVLKIRDENGNFIPIKTIQGESAYEQAKAGGYLGTEEEFIRALASLGGEYALQTINDGYDEHIDDRNNPHKVNAKQVGAIPEEYYLSNDLNAELTQGGNKMTVCYYNSATLNTPRAEGLTDYAHGMVITNAHTEQYGTQFCLPSGDNSIYLRRCNKLGITPWSKLSYEDIEAKFDKTLQKTGGTLSGALNVNKSTNWGQYVISSPKGYYRSFEADDLRIRLDARDETDTNNRRFIDIFTNTADSRHSHALRFSQVKDGASSTAYVLHTANKPYGSYTGNGGKQSIQVGGIGSVLMITSSAQDLAIVTPYCTKYLPYNSNYWNNLSTNECAFVDGVLTIENSYTALNVSGVTYNYQLL